MFRISRTIEIPLDQHGPCSITGTGTTKILMAGPGPAFWVVGTHKGTGDPTSFKPEIWSRQRMPLIQNLEIEGSHPEADGVELIETVQVVVSGVLIRQCRHALHLHQRNRNVLIDACHIFHQRERRDLTAAYRFYCGLDHDGAHGAAADVLATLAILDAQVARYDDLPRTIDGLHEHCTDPKALDLSGMFGRCEEGTVVFIKGKYKGRSLEDIARTKPDYLQWMLRDDYFDDTKRIASEALRQVG